MTFKESEFPDVLHRIEGAAKKFPPKVFARYVRGLLRAYREIPLYPGLIHISTNRHKQTRTECASKPAASIPPSWDALAGKIYRERIRTVIVLGEMDTGKTFFTTYLANRLLTRKRKPAVLDADAGQSDIGPPGTFGLAFLKKPVRFLKDAPVDAMFFLGAHSPGLHLTHALVGIRRLANLALKRSDTVIIDTPGWVNGDGGRLLINTELELLNPDLIVLLQRNRELEHLVRGIPAKRIARLAVSKNASTTSSQLRKELREKLSKKYFKSGRTLTLRTDKLIFNRCFLFTGEPAPEIIRKNKNILHAEKLPGREGMLLYIKPPAIPPFHPSPVRILPRGIERGVLVGLLDRNGDCLGLGLIDRFDFPKHAVRIFTPVRNPSHINQVSIGSLRYNTDGTEAGFLEPGTF